MGNGGSYFLQFIGVLLGFASILFLVYITTRFVGGKVNKSMKGRHISIVETVSIGLDKQIHLVKAGAQFVLIATCGKHIEFLTEIKLEDYNEDAIHEPNNAFDFKSLFDKYLQNFKGRKNDSLTGKSNNYTLDDSGDGENFKSNLNKLKAITTDLGRQRREVGDEHTNEKKN